MIQVLLVQLTQVVLAPQVALLVIHQVHQLRMFIMNIYHVPMQNLQVKVHLAHLVLLDLVHSAAKAHLVLKVATVLKAPQVAKAPLGSPHLAHQALQLTQVQVQKAHCLLQALKAYRVKVLQVVQKDLALTVLKVFLVKVALRLVKGLV